MSMGVIVAGGVILLGLLLVGWMCVRGTRIRADLATKYPPPGQMVDVGGYRLHINGQGCDHSTNTPAVVMVEGSGHHIQVDQPQAVIDAIREVVHVSSQ